MIFNEFWIVKNFFEAHTTKKQKIIIFIVEKVSSYLITTQLNKTNNITRRLLLEKRNLIV